MPEFKILLRFQRDKQNTRFTDLCFCENTYCRYFHALWIFAIPSDYFGVQAPVIPFEIILIVKHPSPPPSGPATPTLIFLLEKRRLLKNTVRDIKRSSRMSTDLIIEQSICGKLKGHCHRDSLFWSKLLKYLTRYLFSSIKLPLDHGE